MQIYCTLYIVKDRPDLSSERAPVFNKPAINICGTVRWNRKGMPRDFGKKLKMKWGDVKVRVRGNLTAVLWDNE
jgi:hypothetical protein